MSFTIQNPHPQKFIKKTWARLYAEGLIRFHLPLLILTAALSAVGFYYSVKLYANLRTDMEELLPASAQSVKDVRAVVNRVGGFNHLSIVIESPDAEANAKFQTTLSAELRKLPPSLVARVEDNVVRERDFFSANKHLYMDLKDWQDLDTYVEARIKHTKAQFKKQTSFHRRQNSASREAVSGTDKGAPQFDFKALEEKYAQRSAEVDRFPGGYFRSANGYTAVVLVFLPGKVTDQSANQKLFDSAKAIVDRLNPKRFDRQMVVGFNGDVSNMIEEHQGLVEDLEFSTIVVLLMVAGVLYAYYRTFAGVYALCAALFAGTFWTFGAAYYLVGYLNANTAFLGSIIIGNGINFGIIMFARYLEERRRGAPLAEALEIAMSFTVRATLVASGAAGLAYASLVITDFRGFNQFGVIGGVGMALCWIATFTVLPGLIVFMEHRHWIKIRPLGQGAALTKYLADFVSRFHRPIVAATAVLSVIAAGLCFKFSADTLESDLSKLRNKKSIQQGSGYWGTKVDAVFQRYLTPTVIVTQTAEQLDIVAAKLKEMAAREGDLSPISDIKVLEDFLPTEQEEKIKHIAHVQKMLTPQVLNHLRARERRKAESILPEEGQPLKPLTASDLPEGVRVHFRELDGTQGRMVHVYPKLASGGAWDGREVIHFAEQLRAAIKESGVPVAETAIAGQPPLSADMIASISRDGPKATVLAFFAVSLLVLLLFRNVRLSLSIVGALLLGVLWMAGVMAFYDLKINFLNFIALPITFGIGVDYAVNVISRYESDRRAGRASIEGALKETGGAVALCSITTVIGYGSLLLAGSQAFVSFGALAVLGEVTCIVAALVALPAIWVYLDERALAVRPQSVAQASVSPTSGVHYADEATAFSPIPSGSVPEGHSPDSTPLL